MLNRIALPIVALASIFSTGCSYMPVSFDVHTGGQTTIQKGTIAEGLVGTLGFGNLANLDISSSQEFKSNNVQKRHVARARLQELKLTITAPKEQNFDFLQSITFFVEAPGLEKKRLAHRDVPRGARAFTCLIDDVELAPYVRADRMTITTTVNGHRPGADTTLQADLTINVGTVLWRGD